MESTPVRLARHAPVLVLPGAFLPELCARLVRLFEDPLPSYPSDGFTSEGHARERGNFKVEHGGDYGRMTELVLREPHIVGPLDGFLQNTVKPLVEKVFQSPLSTREDWRLARYAAPGGFIAPHRDCTTPQTRHRRFTMTVNLTAGDYEGGELCFPEFGPDLYAVERGTAVLWSAHLLHEVRPVTRGTRVVLGIHLGDERAAAARLNPASP